MQHLREIFVGSVNIFATSMGLLCYQQRIYCRMHACGFIGLKNQKQTEENSTWIEQFQNWNWTIMEGVAKE